MPQTKPGRGADSQYSRSQMDTWLYASHWFPCTQRRGIRLENDGTKDVDEEVIFYWPLLLRSDQYSKGFDLKTPCFIFTQTHRVGRIFHCPESRKQRFLAWIFNWKIWNFIWFLLHIGSLIWISSEHIKNPSPFSISTRLTEYSRNFVSS
jgi:hypothetical protein